MPFIGDTVDDIQILLTKDGAAVPFNGATSVRWWLSKTASGPALVGPKTIVDGAPNSFADGYFYPILTNTETATIAEGDYTIGIEVVLSGVTKTFFDAKMIFSKRGL